MVTEEMSGAGDSLPVVHDVDPDVLEGGLTVLDVIDVLTRVLARHGNVPVLVRAPVGGFYPAEAFECEEVVDVSDIRDGDHRFGTLHLLGVLSKDEAAGRRPLTAVLAV